MHKPDINKIEEDEYKLVNAADSTDLFGRLMINQNDKKAAVSEIVTTTVENSEVRQGQRRTYDFLEATMGVAIDKAYEHHEHRADRKFSEKFDTKKVNESIDSIMSVHGGASLSHHVSFEQSFDLSNFEKYFFEEKAEFKKLDISKSQFTRAAAGGRQVEITLDGKKQFVNAKTFMVKVEKDGKIEEMSLHELVLKQNKESGIKGLENLSESSVFSKIEGCTKPVRNLSFEISADAMKTALKGGEAVVKIDGKDVKIDTGSFVIRNSNKEEMTVQNAMKRAGRTRNMQDVYRGEIKKMSRALEQVGIHNAQNLTQRQLKDELKKWKKGKKGRAQNPEVETILEAMIQTKDKADMHKKTQKSKKHTKKGRKAYGRMILRDSELFNGLSTTATITRYAGKAAKASVRFVYRRSADAALIAAKGLRTANRATNAGLKFLGERGLHDNPAMKIYNFNQKHDISDAVVHKAESYKNLESNHKAKKQEKRDVKEEKKTVKKKEKLEKKTQKREKRYTKRAQTRRGRVFNRISDRAKIIREKFQKFTKAFKEVLGAPARLFSTARGWVIKVALIAAGAFLALYLIISIGTELVTVVTGIFSDMTAFSEPGDNGLSVGQQTVNELRAQGADYLAAAQNTDKLTANVPAVSGIHLNNLYYTPTVNDRDVTVIYRDSDRNTISATDYYNIKEIMVISEIYSEYEIIQKNFSDFARGLWEESHSYNIIYDNIYRCTSEETCDNWQEYNHREEEVRAKNCTSYTYKWGYREDGSRWESYTCNRHRGCAGHMKVRVVMTTMRGEKLLRYVADKYGYDYDEMKDRYDILMEADWQDEYNVALGAGTFDSSLINVSGETTQAVYKFLRDCGYSKAGACGIYGNLKAESELNPNALNSAGYFGIAQWGGGRKDALFAFCSAEGLDAYSLEGQLNFLYNELAGGYGPVHSEMMRTNDVIDAACYFAANYEVCIMSKKDRYYGDPDYYYFNLRSPTHQYWQGLPRRKTEAQALFNSVE